MSIDSIRASINKKMKGEVLGFGNHIEAFERIPFSSPRLNHMTRGGIPNPGAIEISGGEGSGKTTLLGDIVKNAQKMGLMCAFTDTENKTDMDYWKWLGVDLSQLLVCKPIGLTGEEILELQFDLIAQGIRLCGLDSVASLVPKSVMDGTMEDKTYCGSSGILSTFSQKLTGSGILIKNRANLVGINQVRDKMNGFGLSTPGGHFWRHACMCRIQLSKSSPFDADYKALALSTPAETTGHFIDAKMLKNQFSKNDRKMTTFTLNYTTGIDVLEDLVDVAMNYGIIVQAGAWYRIINPSTGELLCLNGEDVKFQGRQNMRTFLRDKSAIAKWLETQVNNILTIERTNGLSATDATSEEQPVEEGTAE